MTDEPDATFALVMPFVVCTSHGGPYEDHSFVAGYELGILDNALAAWPTRYARMMRSASLPQVDLLAMKHGYRLRATSNGEEWSFVELTRDEARDSDR